VSSIKFDYGKNGIEIKINPSWNVTVMTPEKQELIENPIQSIKNSIQNPIGSLPLRDIVDKKKSVKQLCIVVDDATRPVPSKIVLEALVEELNSYGIEDNQILILIATGLHRRSHEYELERILGKELKKRLKVIDHVASDKNSLKFFGNTIDKVPIYINKNYCESDLKILTGYVEPHFFFGFSGGRKSIIPGIAGVDTVQENHSAENIAHLKARFGIDEGNPMHENAKEISELVGSDFIINVCINEHHEITQVAAGDIKRVHENLVKYQLNYTFKEIEEPYDIVICGNGGYPLDLNLYQAVKSMAIAEIAVKNGGTIISVNELSEGVGIGQDNFRDLIFSGKTPKTLYEQVLKKEIIVPDQWEIQVLTRIMKKAEIYVISSLKKEEIGNIGLKHADSVEEAIEASLRKYGQGAKILILPNGPQVIPMFKK
jgi:nickel-dependent lactate racemase